MTKNDGGPAFPVEADYPHEPGSYGMSLRDYFAGQALAGMCAATMSRAEREDIADGTRGGKYYYKAAYVLADAMIAERNKGETHD